MKRKPTRKYDILAVYSLEDASGREHFSGILKYLTGKNDWRLHVCEPGNRFTAADVRGTNGIRYDGIIVSLPGTPDTMRELSRSRIPTVLVNIDDRSLSARTDNISFIWLDNAEIGKCGAEHLLAQGDFAEFGFVPDPNGLFFNRERAIAYRDVIRSAGKRCLVFAHPADGTGDTALIKWLRDLRKPAAVMAANAITAGATLKACQKLKLKVPEDVAILSVGADTFLSEASSPTVSSVLPNFVEMGFRAAEELDRIISSEGRRKFHETIITSMEIATRESTRFSGAAESLVRRAEAYIHDHSHEDVRAQQVVRYLGCSRRLAELRFSQLRHQSIRLAIEDARLAQAVRALSHTDADVRHVAADLHFRSGNALSRIFKRHYGMTIGEWKLRNFRRGSPE